MSRISIDVTAEQHQRLKALAALQGKSIKEFVLASTLGAHSGGAMDRELTELEGLLDRRAREAGTRGGGTRTVGEIFQQAREDREAASPDPDA